MARNSRDFTYDNALLLKDAGLVAADAAATVASAAKILDLGLGRVDSRVIVDVTAVEVADNNERFIVVAQFSNSASFASGIVNGTCLQLGALEVTLQSADTPVGRYELPFTNEINGTLYRYMRLYIDVAGTVGTGVNFTAFAVTR